MNKVEKIFNDSSNPADFAKAYIAHLSAVLAGMDVNQIARFVEVLKSARDSNHTIFFLGNGGSAATASHFVNDITIGTRSWDKPFRAICLSDNVAGLTAIGNDYGYEDIFLLPLKAHLRKGDVVVAISASGNSPNLVKAIDYANDHGATTVALTGFEGGKLRKMAKHSVHVQTASGEYGPVEDAHMVLDHLTHAYLMYSCAKENPK